MMKLRFLSLFAAMRGAAMRRRHISLAGLLLFLGLYLLCAMGYFALLVLSEYTGAQEQAFRYVGF